MLLKAQMDKKAFLLIAFVFPYFFFLKEEKKTLSARAE